MHKHVAQSSSSDSHLGLAANPSSFYSFERIGTVLFPVLGIVFCVSNGLGAKLACFSSGCSVYSDYSYLGISFYWYGCMAFACALIVAFLNGSRPGVFFGFTSLFLLVDAGFMLWLAFFLPCSSCLVVGILIAGSFLSGLFHLFRTHKPGSKTKLFSILILSLWTPLFVVGVTDSIRELTKPWVIYGDPETADYEIWFSLTCPKCEETLKTVLSTPGMMDNVALYPVSKGEKDLEKFKELYCGLQGEIDLKDALEASLGMRQCTWSDQQLGFWGELFLQIRLQWNKALLVRKGYSSVPILVSNKIAILDEHGCQIETDGSGCMASEHQFPSIPQNTLQIQNDLPGATKESDIESCDVLIDNGCSL